MCPSRCLSWTCKRSQNKLKAKCSLLKSVGKFIDSGNVSNLVILHKLIVENSLWLLTSRFKKLVKSFPCSIVHY